MTETPQQRIERIRKELRENGGVPTPASPKSPQEPISATPSRVAEVRAKVGINAPQEATQAPERPNQTFAEKAGGMLNTVFGGGTIGRAIGTQTAKAEFERSPIEGPSTGDRARAEEIFKRRTGKDIDFSEETQRREVSESTFKGPKATEIAGDVARVGLTLAPFTRVGTAAFAAKPILAGAGLGAATSAAGTIAEGGETEEAIKSAAVGGVIGGAFGAAGKMIGKTVANRSERAALARSGTPDARAASVKVTPKGQIVPDKVAREAIRQGVPEADIASIKTASASDKKSMSNMLAIRRRQMTQRTSERATDVVGRNFVEKVAKPVEKLNKDAGQRLNQVAARLAGKKVNASKPVSAFAESLNGSGIKFDRAGNIRSFKGSDFEGLRSVQTDIRNVWERLRRVAKTGDAHELHRLKSYIDSIVEYGAEGRGLQGKASALLKGLRHEVDALLDSNFPAYNKVNTQFADTIRVMEQVNTLLGRRMRLGDQFADARLGVKMRSLLSNSQSRAEIMKVLKEAQETAGKYGVEVIDDIERQAYFADLLERLAGTEAPTSFLGQTERAIGSTGKDVAMAGAEILRGNVFGAAARGTKAVIEGVQGINLENQLRALESLLVDGTERAASNFGRIRK